MRYFTVLLLFTLFLSCKSEKEQPQSTTPTPQKAEARFTALPNDLMMKIWNEGDLIDYIFHNLPFSMNQDEQASIRTNLTYIGEEAQDDIPNGCKPFGRQFFQVEGEMIFEADIYYSDGCMFYVFFVDGKAKYANKMSDSGKAFFKTMIRQGLKARQGMTG